LPCWHPAVASTFHDLAIAVLIAAQLVFKTESSVAAYSAEPVKIAVATVERSVAAARMAASLTAVVQMAAS
jgi:hypothetical protein